MSTQAVEHIEVTWEQRGEAKKMLCHPDWFTIICFREMDDEERERWDRASAKALGQIRHEMGWEVR